MEVSTPSMSATPARVKSWPTLGRWALLWRPVLDHPFETPRPPWQVIGVASSMRQLIKLQSGCLNDPEFAVGEWETVMPSGEALSSLVFAPRWP